MDDMAGDLRDDARWQRLKRKHNIRVDETAHNFLEFRRICLLMVDQVENNLPRCAPRRHWDCCVITSEHQKDIAVARNFQRTLHTSGFVACLVQDSCPGSHQLKEVETMLRGSTTLFLLCTAELLQDRGIATLAYQDQLVAYMRRESSNGKKIVPLRLPIRANDDNLPLADQPWSREHSGNQLVRPDASRHLCYQETAVVPFGINVFKEIVLGDPQLYMEQVKMCISLCEQTNMRRDHDIAQQTYLLSRNRQKEEQEQQSISEALKLIDTPNTRLRTIGQLIANTQSNVPGDLQHDGVPQGSSSARTPRPADVISTILAEHGAIHEPPVQQAIDVRDSSGISIGTSYHFHIEESSFL